MKHLLREAEAGKADAQFNLGVFYDNGLDDNGYPIAAKRAEAIKWLLAAARQGLPRAQMRLAEAYLDQPDAFGNRSKAYLWFLLASVRLDGIHRERAQSECERLAGELTPKELARAARLARLWKPERHAMAAAGSPPRLLDIERSSKN